MSTKRIEIELDNGYKLVAETGTDSNYPAEIYVGIETPDGSWWQDLATVKNEYEYNDDGSIEYKDGKYEVLVYGREYEEDYTERFEIDLYKEE